jgi:hypothetical protein
MKRQHPLFSTFGILFTVLMLLGLVLMIVTSGGKAFSPGRLSAKSRPAVSIQGFASHVDFETECSRCHAPLETTQDVLCTNCHSNVNTQIKIQNGTHGHIENVNECARCHSDHQGRDFDLTRAAFTYFDHTMTHFSLAWHQVNYDATPMPCNACHNIELGFSTAMDNCAYCHASEDIAYILGHIQDYDENCLLCHDGQDRMVDFDHQATAFPLDGRHAALSCNECHQLRQQAQPAPAQPGQAGIFALTQAHLDQTSGDPFKNTPSACRACHSEPGIHKGIFSPNCNECHSSDGWLPANLTSQPFDHASHTGFSLVRHYEDFDGQRLSCNLCHPNDLESFDIQSCLTCHMNGEDNQIYMQAHINQYGVACLDCHDGIDRMANFDHTNVFPLDGRHVEITCEACHVAKIFRGTPSECVLCHAEPPIHAGFFGPQCQNCHTTHAWTPAFLQAHTFPLDHGRLGETACQTCHLQRYVEYTCYGCHDHQPDLIAKSHERGGISTEELTSCMECHPTGLIEIQQ